MEHDTRALQDTVQHGASAQAQAIECDVTLDRDKFLEDLWFLVTNPLEHLRREGGGHSKSLFIICTAGLICNPPDELKQEGELHKKRFVDIFLVDTK